MSISKRYHRKAFRHAKKRPTGPSSSGPTNIWGNEFPGHSGAETSPRRATEGSMALDLCATTRLVLTPQMGVQPIPSDFHGSLPQNTVGLLLRRSSATLKGLIVHPGIVDQDYKGQLKIICSSPRGIFPISPVDRIAQLHNF